MLGLDHVAVDLQGGGEVGDGQEGGGAARLGEG